MFAFALRAFLYKTTVRFGILKKNMHDYININKFFAYKLADNVKKSKIFLCMMALK